jgi:hypothetical protein
VISGLAAEQEVHHVAIFDHVLLAFSAFSASMQLYLKNSKNMVN